MLRGAEVDVFDGVINGGSEVYGLVFGSSLRVHEHVDVQIEWALERVCRGASGVDWEEIRTGFVGAAVQEGACGAGPEVRDDNYGVEVGETIGERPKAWAGGAAKIEECRAVGSGSGWHVVGEDGPVGFWNRIGADKDEEAFSGVTGPGECDIGGLGKQGKASDAI